MENRFAVTFWSIGNDNKRYVSEYLQLTNDVIMKQVTRSGEYDDNRPRRLVLKVKNNERVNLAEVQNMPDLVSKLDNCFYEDVKSGSSGIQLLYSYSWIDVGVKDNKFVYGQNQNSVTDGFVFVPDDNCEEISPELKKEVELFMFAGLQPDRDLLANDNEMEMGE